MRVKTKTKKQKKIRVDISQSTEDRVMRLLYNLNHRGLQRECALRGMAPEKVIGRPHTELVSWLHTNFDNSQDEKNLVILDTYVEQQLESRGYKKGDAVFSPALRFAFTPEIGRIDKLKDPTKPEKIEKIKKPKAEIDEKTGVRKGTKKALTYQLTSEGFELDYVTKQVKEAFPDAEAKSIRIWYKRCKSASNK